MKLKTLRDSDVFEKPEYDTPEEYQDRHTVKIIIKNQEGEIALVTNPIHKLFLLAGGGAESDDLKSEAIREALEETSYHIEILETFAEMEEFRNREAKHYLTTCFIAKAVERNNEDLRTEEEKKNGLKVKWFSLDEGKKLMHEQAERVKKNEIKFYNTAFNVMRDFEFIKRLEN